LRKGVTVNPNSGDIEKRKEKAMEALQVEAKRYGWKPELKDKLFFFALCPFLLLVSSLWFLMTALFVEHILLVRAVGIISFLVTILLCLSPQGRQRKGLILVLWAAFMLTRISPVEVSIENYPGSPHWVRLAMGLPSEKGWERAEKGEVMLGGCLVNPYRCEPKWVLVW
jgi:hypothetical protein